MKHIRARLVTLLALGSLAAQSPPSADKLAFVQVDSARDTYFVHEPVPLTLRFGFAAGVIEDHLIQLSRQRLDVPARIDAAILETGRATTPQAIPAAAGMTFALNGRRATGWRVSHRERDGRRWLVLEYSHTIVPNKPGPLRLPGPVLRFAHAASFAEDFLGERQPTGRRDLQVTGQARTLVIRPLPASDRPRSFTGAVGNFTISAEAAPRTIIVGESFRLTVVIKGRGDLSGVPFPRLDELAEFHVYGQLEDDSPDQRRLVVDLSPLRAETAAVPPIRWSYFDPSPPARYREVATSAIPIDVRPDPDQTLQPITAMPRAPSAGVDDIFDLMTTSPPTDVSRRLAPGPLVAGLLAPWLLALGIVVGRWWRRRHLTTPTPARQAALLCQQQLAAGTEVTAALAEFLARQLDCSAAATIDPSLATRLELAGVPSELIQQTMQLLEQALATRFGGAAIDRQRVVTGDLIERLAQVFDDSGGTA